MDANQMILKLQKRRFEIFKAQNPDSSDLDVCFDIGGKKLYAHKSLLTSVSETFQKMLSETWTTPNEPIIITNYSSDDFFEFLTFIYSCECKLNDENILSMVDISEFYNLDLLKDVCDDYITNMTYTPENIFKLLVAAEKYSMTKVKDVLLKYIFGNFKEVTASDGFLELEKGIVEDLIIAAKDVVGQEDSFEAIYRWAENKGKEANLPDKDADEVIKENLSDILSNFNFRSMNNVFLIKFVLGKTCLFSRAEMADILMTFHQNIIVKITDEVGNSLKAEFNDKWNVFDAIMKVKNSSPILNYVHFHYISWKTNVQKPPTPSEITPSTGKKKRQYYLVWDYLGNLAVKNQLEDSDYLLTEMSTENRKFELISMCSIAAEYK